MKHSRQLFGGGIVLIATWAVVAGITQDAELRVAPRLPSSLEISNTDFGALIDALSEPEGYFDTDNFITNETSYLHVIPELREHVSARGVYLGVGPGQNFSYIVHTNPTVAIITDIRRQNMLQHLVFKVLIEQADSRVGYLCALLAKDCDNVSTEESFPEWLMDISQAPDSIQMLEQSIARVRSTLLDSYELDLSPADIDQIEYIQRSFASAGLSMRFSSYGRASTGYPTLEEILLARDLAGEYQSYLASDELFERLQNFQVENRLIPVVGDFSGRQALPAVARFLRDHSLEVSVFYVSNVEFYLTGRTGWDAWVDNLRQFPFRSDAVFVRAYFPTGWPRHPLNVPGHRPTSLVQDVDGFLADSQSRPQWNYWDVVTRHLK